MQKPLEVFAYMLATAYRQMYNFTMLATVSTISKNFNFRGISDQKPVWKVYYFQYSVPLIFYTSGNLVSTCMANTVLL